MKVDWRVRSIFDQMRPSVESPDFTNPLPAAKFQEYPLETSAKGRVSETAGRLEIR